MAKRLYKRVDMTTVAGIIKAETLVRHGWRIVETRLFSLILEKVL